MHIIDTHAHLDMSEFNNDLDAVLERANKSGVNTIATIGIDLKSSYEAINLSQRYSGIYASVGIHPHNAEGVIEKDINQLHELSKGAKVVALGEMGLDYYRNLSPKESQLKVFRWQLELANQTSLPVIIHCREALDDMIEVLNMWSAASKIEGPKGIIHCFSGDFNTAKTYIDMGFYLALGGYITYPSSSSFTEVIRNLPLNRLVLETDCPFLPPQSYRGKRNEPAYTLLTLEHLSKIREIPVEQAARETSYNAQTVFRI